MTDLGMQFIYQTPVYSTEEEAWLDLEAFMKQHAEGYILFMRVSPEVNREYLFDEKRRIYRGYVRFFRWGEKHEDSISIGFALSKTP